MANLKLSSKRLQIDKANQAILILLAVSVFVTIFCGFLSKALLSKRSYQGKIIKGKETALKQLKSDVTAADSLKSSYQAFVGSQQNIIGGDIAGTKDRDGDNARIVLDALPSKYDFPALATSLEKILTDKNYTIGSITGTDDEVAQSAADTGTDQPKPVPIPFSISVTGTYASMQGLIKTLEQSIRPIQITSLTMTGNDKALQIDITANTYYQSEKVFKITTKDVK